VFFFELFLEGTATKIRKKIRSGSVSAARVNPIFQASPSINSRFLATIRARAILSQPAGPQQSSVMALYARC